MSRRNISLKGRVRYERRAQDFDRRSDQEELPNRIWYTVGQVLRKNFQKVSRRSKSITKTPTGS